jgi:hypothetical protein
MGSRLRTTIKQPVWRLTPLLERARKGLERGAVSMGLAGIRPIAASGGPPQLPSGYRYLLAHAIATLLLLITLAAVGWQFVAWVAEPSACLIDSSQSLRSSQTTPPVAIAPTASYHYSARAKLAVSDSGCPCPEER